MLLRRTFLQYCDPERGDKNFLKEGGLAISNVEFVETDEISLLDLGKNIHKDTC